MRKMLFIVLFMWLKAPAQEVISSGDALYRTNFALINHAIGSYESSKGAQPVKHRPVVDLQFKRSAVVSKKIRTEFIGQMAKVQPGLRSHWEKILSNNQLRDEFDRLLSGYGYSGQNVADAMTAYLVISWQIVNDKEFNDREGFDAVRKTVRQQLSSLRALATADDAAKQSVAETFAYQSMIALSIYKVLKSGTQQEALTSFCNSIYNQVKSSGVDLRKVKLSRKGFVKAGV